MAGCLPSYLPVVVAAVRAMCQQQFNLAAIQATTNPVTPLIIINGPIAQQIGVNSGYNCLGQGWRANATIGRAIRLILINVGGATPGIADRATAGQPGKYTFCFAENEASNPWQPLHVERGFESTASTVTVLGASGTINIIDSSDDAGGLLMALAGSMTILGSNDYLFGGEPLLILCPEHAGVLAKAGLSKDEVKKRLFEATKVPLGRFPQNAIERIAHNRSDELAPIGSDTTVPLTKAPEDLVLVVAGGAGQHSVYVPTFGITRAVTVGIE